jgi:hypothetical protein
LPLLATLSEKAENYAVSDGTTSPQSELGPDRKAMNDQFGTSERDADFSAYSRNDV